MGAGTRNLVLWYNAAVRLTFIILALAPAAAWCGNVVTNATDLMRCLGFDGSAGVEFILDATVVQGTWSRSKDFVVKASDGYIKLVDKTFWPTSFIRNGDRIRAHGLSFIIKAVSSP